MCANFDTTPEVMFACKMIRVANTHPTGIELMKQQNEKKLRAAIRAIEDKLPANRKRRKKKGKTAEEKKLELATSQPPPRRLQTLQDMRKAAGILYAFSKQQSKTKKLGAQVGKPRVIFPDIVQDVRRMVEENQLDEPVPRVEMFRVSDRGDGAGKRPGSARLRPLSARRRGDGGREMEEEECDEHGEGKGGEQDHGAGCAAWPTLSKRPHSANAALRRSQALQRKEALQQRKEQDLLDRITTRDTNGTIRYAALQRAARQRALLVLLALVRHAGAAQDIVLAHRQAMQAQIEEKRTRKNVTKYVRLFSEGKVTWAARAIGLWCRQQRVNRVIRKNRKTFILLVCILNRFKWFCRRKRRRAAVLVVRRFVQDVSGMGEVMIMQLKRWITKIRTLQRFVRRYILVQSARLQVLCMVMDRMGAARREKRAQQERINERSALQAMSADERFGRTISNMVTLQNKIKLLHREQEAKERQHQRAQAAQALHAAREAETRREALLQRTRRGGFSGHASHAKHTSKSLLWLYGMASTPASLLRLQRLRQVLRQQRRRHILSLDELRKNLKKATRLVNEEALKDFLMRPQQHDTSRIFTLVDANGNQLKESAHFPPFLLFRGAIAFLEQMPDSFF